MKKFTFRFDALAKFREHQRDRCQEVLGQLMTEDRRLADEAQAREDQRLALMEEMRTMMSEGQVDPRAIANRRYYAGQLSIEKSQFEQQRVKIGQGITQARTLLAEAEAKVKALERLKDDQKQEHLKEAYKLADQEMEEAWMAGQLGRQLRGSET